jgi:hypothetical protein
MSLKYEVAKTYPQRGSLQQYRLKASTAFGCFRCRSSKTSKLVVVFNGDWNQLLCNGCYGRLLSIFEIKAGTDSLEDKSARLAEQLEALLPPAEAQQAEQALVIRENRSALLQPRSLRLLATADYVARHLDHATDLDWSAAVIGLCKSFEVELVSRLIEPLAKACTSRDLSNDMQDKDMGRLARYCARRTETPPEIGVVGHFLQTAVHSKDRQATSELIDALRGLVRSWPHSEWLISPDGALPAMAELTSRFRNRAAHTDELNREDYEAAASLVSGTDGILWKLVRSTSAVRSAPR